MPRFNASDAPIAQDNYDLIAVRSNDPIHDASVVGVAPAVLTDWDGATDPGNVDAALDQLAERVDDNEIAIAGLTADHGSLSGLTDDDHTQYVLADGSRDLTGDLLVTGSKELRLRTAAQRLYSPGSNAVAIDAATQLQTKIGGNTEIVVFADQMSFLAGGTDDPNLNWSTADQLDLRIGTTVLATFKSGQVDVSGIVRGSGLRARSGTSSGAVQTNTLTGDSLSPSAMGSKAALDHLPAGYTTMLNVGWVKIYVGTTPMLFPVWS